MPLSFGETISNDSLLRGLFIQAARNIRESKTAFLNLDWKNLYLKTYTIIFTLNVLQICGVKGHGTVPRQIKLIQVYTNENHS